MQFLLELLPIAIFFIAYKFFGIYVATSVAIITTLIQVFWTWKSKGKVDPMLWITLAIITVFGGATLFLHDESFIKWKPTILYWLFATVLTGGTLIFKKNFIHKLLSHQLDLPDFVWQKLNIAWITFFSIMGGANLYVANNYSTDQWVDFKLFGTLGITLVFALIQGVMISKYLKPEISDELAEAQEKLKNLNHKK